MSSEPAAKKQRVAAASGPLASNPLASDPTDLVCGLCREDYDEKKLSPYTSCRCSVFNISRGACDTVYVSCVCILILMQSHSLTHSSPVVHLRRLLPCGHTYCTFCRDGLFKSASQQQQQQPSIRCPRGGCGVECECALGARAADLPSDAALLAAIVGKRLRAEAKAAVGGLAQMAEEAKAGSLRYAAVAEEVGRVLTALMQFCQGEETKLHTVFEEVYAANRSSMY